MLTILANFIPEHERVLVIEDTAEIQITNPNLLALRPAVNKTDFLP